jgi:sigma-B regulation protein RsbU (phosphoserine phosphatase)
MGEQMPARDTARRELVNKTVQESGRKTERRQQQSEVSFPLTLADGVCVCEDRRRNEERRRKPFIAELLLFTNIQDERLARILAGCPVRECSGGEILLAPAQANHNIYLVLSGRLTVRIGNDGSAPPLMVESGECVGELSIIDGKPVSAFVVAEHRCRVLVISDTVFWSQIIALPGVARNLLTILSERIRQEHQIIIQNVRQRLQYEHIEKELQTARTIQASMLPRGYPLFPGHDEFDVHALMDPAKEIGGDFFDAFLIGDDKLFFAIGDVSGKGVPAALFMVKTVTLLRMEGSRDIPPQEVLNRVNQQLCHNNDYGMFATVFCGILDLASGTLAYCNGGHDAPLLGRAGAGFEFIESAAGLMLGATPDGCYQSSSLELKTGDLVVCYTDGVTEAMNLQQELFAQDRLRESVAGMEKAEAEHLVRVLHAEIRAFAQGAPQSDDIAILALKYRGTA